MILKKYTLLLAAALIYAQSPCLASDLEQAVKELSAAEAKPFQFFDAFPQEDAKILENMKIKSGNIDSYYRFDGNCQTKDFENFLAAIEESPEKNKIASILQAGCKRIMKKIPNSRLRMFGYLDVQNGKVHITSPWHLDKPEEFCNCKEPKSLLSSILPINRKILVNICGDGTIFADLNAEQKANIGKYLCQNNTLEDIKTVEDTIPTDNQQQLQQGQGVLFSVEKAVHKGPGNCHEKPRVLMSITYR